MKMLYLILIISFIGGNLAQTPGIGSCPPVKTISSFDPSKYVGLWYENRRSIPNFFELGGKCVTANYSAINESTIKVVNRKISPLTGTESVIVGSAVADKSQCGNNTSCSKLIVEFPIPIVGKAQGTYWILDTDYTSYSIVWSCTDFIFSHVKYLWVLTREPKPPKSVLDKANTIMEKYGIADTPTMETNQDNCP
ncbi:hypothetical protein PV326_011835 [Microctonus aethiopoides]|uniref:Apolipoprotein D n=1 Tax=Microctonus aethiopoides TaxID=144406 RepID=A0AA39FKQ0_9HYME|nr:hypothetical protein PV326_011835 [Microctonus aethiopoides]KAK0171211.1 hypothetical protein PV328_008962 [Microctonus aethiopoides]